MKFSDRGIADQIVLVLAGVSCVCILMIMGVLVWEIFVGQTYGELEKLFVWLSRLISTIIGFVFGYITKGVVQNGKTGGGGKNGSGGTHD